MGISVMTLIGLMMVGDRLETGEFIRSDVRMTARLQDASEKIFA